MKTKQYIFLIIFCLAYSFLQAEPTVKSFSTVQYRVDDIERGNYIVVGAFKYEKNAKRWVLIALKNGFNGRYFYNESRGLFYVYVHNFSQKSRAITITKKIRSFKLFDDVWVFSVGDSANLDLESNNLETTIGQSVEEEIPNAGTPQITTPVATEETSPAIAKLRNAKVGERVVFEKLLFHKSSAILRSVAREDLTDLYSFLNANPTTKIKIHGHTNGKFKGDIILLKKEDDSYYRLSRKNIVIKGNEMRLSAERALLLKRFLVDSGVDSDRVEVKGWGAKKMIYNKEHFKSAQNRRVEVEIIE